ncbi:MAG: DUF2807 domain-containing protein [Parachlamydiaceae bacterium]|nr:DUF2807 domain-containing protein [Parachlamydiaceae bacterium]
MKVFLTLLCSCLILISWTSCSKSKSKNELTGSGNVISQVRNVMGFNQILFSGNGNLIISQGNTESLKIEGEDNIVDLITTAVVDKALRIDYKKANMAHLINSKAPLNIYVQVKDIQEIRLSGSGSISTIKPLTAFQLKVSVSGSGSGQIGIIGHKLVTILSGSSNFIVSGTVENQDIWISGSGDYQAEKLTSKVANVNITGSGKVTVNVQDDIDVHISGAGTVNYQGTPRIRQSISGSGSITRASEGI